MQNYLVPLFEKYGVNLVLNGHDHDYERFNAVNSSGTGVKVPYIVTGGGGGDLYEKKTEHADTAVFVSAYHFAGLVVKPKKIQGVAIGTDGIALDSFVIEK